MNFITNKRSGVLRPRFFKFERKGDIKFPRNQEFGKSPAFAGQP